MAIERRLLVPGSEASPATRSSGCSTSWPSARSVSWWPCVTTPSPTGPRLTRIAVGLSALALVLGVLTMTVGYPEGVLSPGVCEFC